MASLNEMIEKLKEKALNPKEREPKAKRFSDRAPLVHVPKGTTLARFYMDQEGEAVRTVLVHQRDGAPVPCTGDGCEICAYLTEIGEFGGKWKFEATEKSIAYATIFDYQGDDGEYVKMNVPILLVGGWRLKKDIYDLIRGLELEDIRELFDPAARSAVWIMKKEGKIFSCGLHAKRQTMDPLPDHLVPLSQCFVAVGSVPTKDEIEGFVEKIRKAVGKADSRERPRQTAPITSADSGQAKKLEEKTEADQPPAAYAKVQEDSSKHRPQSDDEKKECFGQHPDSQDPTCLLCDNEDDCLEATDE